MTHRNAPLTPEGRHRLIGRCRTARPRVRASITRRTATGFHKERYGKRSA